MYIHIYIYIYLTLIYKVSPERNYVQWRPWVGLGVQGFGLDLEKRKEDIWSEDF